MRDCQISERRACGLRDELLNEELLHNLPDARRKLAVWRYDHNNVRPHSSRGNG
jgi:putative transposase